MVDELAVIHADTESAAARLARCDYTGLAYVMAGLARTTIMGFATHFVWESSDEGVAVGRETSDEAYVLDLCDEALGERGQRQARFEWLVGDPGKDGRRRQLPVDGYWPEHRLIVEYRERQHEEPVAHFDKPDRMTVSGVHRGLQRALYDRRREQAIPVHGLRLVVIRPADLAADRRGRLRRNHDRDLPVVRAKVEETPVLSADA